MKLLYLSSLITVPNKEGEEKIAKALENKVKTDDNGKNADWYKELGLIPPKDMQNENSSEIDEDGMMMLKPSEFEYSYVDCVLKLSDFSYCIDNVEIGCTIFTKNGDEIFVEELSEQIYGYIAVLNRAWYTILIDDFKYYFQILLRKIKKNK